MILLPAASQKPDMRFAAMPAVLGFCLGMSGNAWLATSPANAAPPAPPVQKPVSARAKTALRTKDRAAAAAKTGKQQGAGKAPHTSTRMTLQIFLDRLMRAESNGRDDAANPRSSARGAFQFINATFLFIVRRHFPEQAAKLTTQQILALRFDRAFARKAAAAYTYDNAVYLAQRGLKPSYANLRLAFLLGPGGARKILIAKPATPIRVLLSRATLRANPFLARLTAKTLLDRAARDISLQPGNRSALAVKLGKGARARRPAIKVACNLTRPSCRRWLALKTRKLKRRNLRKNLRKKRKTTIKARK